MAFVKRRIKFLSMVTAGLLLLSGLLFSFFVFSPRPAAQATTGSSANSGEGFYVQTNLVSDLPNIAKFQDPNLVNSWGLVHSPTSPWWVADNGKSVSTVYNGNGTPVNPLGGSSPLVVSIPAPGGGPGGTPTGIVFNSVLTTNPDDFVVSEKGKSGPSIFMFATEDGTISGWNPTVDVAHAILAVDRSTVSKGKFTGAVYKGLATGQDDGKDFIYATNFRFGTVEMFNAHFKLVKSFTDKQLANDCPSPNQCFAPFGIRNIGGRLYVTYALQNAEHHDDVAGLGNGFVDVFDTVGHLLRRFASHGTLNSPWGLTLTPRDFGPFSNDLLVGNFGDGHINVFNPKTGAFLGQLPDQAGDPISINGLWGIDFGNGVNAGERDELFFAAGLNDEANGLFGKIQFVRDDS
ncbi:MAG TPA: TIGR03118 family protein [Ktedonobacteraceae bacterium]|nr:TIGR03118 family protein [Ktedonobacteraceae bacterium]